jgi:hypothetical protein
LHSHFAPSLAFAQGNGKGKAKGHDKHDQGNDGDQGRAYERYGLHSRDREVVTAYYSKHDSGLPPGLAKRNGNLPPGLEKQLERNGTLPPGLQKKLQPCPVEITRELPPLPPDYQRWPSFAHTFRRFRRPLFFIGRKENSAKDSAPLNRLPALWLCLRARCVQSGRIFPAAASGPLPPSSHTPTAPPEPYRLPG